MATNIEPAYSNAYAIIMHKIQIWHIIAHMLHIKYIEAKITDGSAQIAK
jgi:hypothetical protein